MLSVASRSPDSNRYLLAGDIEINDPVLQVAYSQAHGLAAKSYQHAMRVHIAVVGREGGDRRWKAIKAAETTNTAAATGR